MTGTNPTVHLTVGRNRRTRYGADQYRLKDGDEYELELHNPTTGTVGARLTVDGRPLGSTTVVLRPGERVYIERWLDEARKLRFGTYAVDDTPGNRAAVSRNGVVRAEFLRERVPPPPPVPNPWVTLAAYPYAQYSFTAGAPDADLGAGTCSLGSASASAGINFCSTDLTGADATYSRSFDSAPEERTRGGQSTNHLSRRVTTKSTSFGGEIKAKNAAPEMLTGRSEKGSHSGQSFQRVSIEFEHWAFHTEEFRIMPLDSEDAQDAVKKYCTGCGTRARRQTWKWCPNCGTKI